MEKQRIISITVNNVAGIINKVTGLIIRKGFSIDSLAVSETENIDVSCMTITLSCDEEGIQRAIKQLNTLIDVVEVMELKEENSVLREHILMKTKDSLAIRKVVANYMANIVKKKGEIMVIEFTGDTKVANAFVEEMVKIGILTIARSGKVAVSL